MTLEGQLVCSECWFEADRKTTAYGTAADLQCAADCAVKGVPPAVAVKHGAEFKLYLIEAGQFKQNSEEWLTYIGKWVQVSGRLFPKKDKQHLAVDEFKVLASPRKICSRLPCSALTGINAKGSFRRRTETQRLSRQDCSAEFLGHVVHSLPQRNAPTWRRFRMTTRRWVCR